MLILSHIKGYVVDRYQEIPVTWDKETNKYVENVRKVFVFTDKVVIDKRIYDTRIPKKEIIRIEEKIQRRAN